MRLLKLRIDGALLFCDHRLELDFVATDRVPRDEDGNIYGYGYLKAAKKVFL